MGYQNDVRQDDLTNTILDRAVEVHKELGPDHREHTYRDSLQLALEQDGFSTRAELDFAISFRGKEVGEGKADLVVEQSVALELKVVRHTEERHFQQLARTVRNLPTTRGLLLNFGQPTLDVRRYADGYEPN